MIKQLELKHFRAFDSYSLDTNYTLNIIVGKNALGKTSLLEAIYFTATTKSERSNNFLDLIKDGSLYSTILLKTSTNRYDVILSEKGKKLLINQKPYTKLSDYIGHLKAILFTPQDLLLITGEKALRRNFFDLVASLINKKYLIVLNEFKKLLKKRNELLKQDNSDEILLKVITSQLTEVETYLMECRFNLVEKLNIFLNTKTPTLKNGEKIEIKYEPSIKGNINQFYEQKLSYDKLTKMTNYGIHRDDYHFYLNDKMAKNYASQGQVRSIAISLKIAVAKLIEEVTKDNVILLLDDVFSELDLDRQKALVTYLLSAHQAFITTTDLNGLPSSLLDKAHLIQLKEDHLWQQKKTN